MMKLPPFKNDFLTELKNISSFYVVVFIIGILTALVISIPRIIFISLLGIIPPLFYFRKRYLFLKPIFYFLLFFLLGLSVMTYRINHTQTPTISKPIYDTVLSGQITEVSHLLDKQRLILSDIRFLNQPTIQTPHKIKLTYASSTPLLEIGDSIQATAFLRPPLAPSAPYMYNEKRTSFFQGIGAIGKIDNLLTLHKNPSSFQTKLSELRTHISQRIQTTISEETARIAIPLTIGEQGVVSEHLYHIFRSAGIIHILSVSGFHLSLLAAFIFFLTRSILALFPFIVEQFSTKKIAAFFALIIAGGYILISGMQIPAIRSFIMIAVVLIALLFDRNALSTRSLSVAAFIILFFAPEMILNIGFQLSFTAVLILTTLYPQLRQWLFPNKPTSVFKRFFVLIGCLLLLDFLITLTTLPLTIYHFKQLAPYGLLGNLLTTTILSFWIMPFLFLGLTFMPFGTENIFLKPAAVGLEYIIALCEKIDSLPNALINFPAYNITALLTMMAGIILLCLMKTKLRFVGILIFFAGLTLSTTTSRPHLLIGDKGQTLAVYQNGQLQFLSKSQNEWTAKNWLSFYGQSENPQAIGIPNTLSLNGKKISFRSQNCVDADLCILPTPNPKEHNAISLYAPQNRFIYLNNDKVQIKNIDF